MQQQGLFRKKIKNSKFKISIAEKKLLFVFTYYIIFIAIALTYYSVTIRDYAYLIVEVEKYFMCEAFGYNPDDPCPKNYEQYTYTWLSTVTYLLMNFVPTINLIFVINVRVLKAQCLRRVGVYSVSSSMAA